MYALKSCMPLTGTCWSLTTSRRKTSRFSQASLALLSQQPVAFGGADLSPNRSCIVSKSCIVSAAKSLYSAPNVPQCQMTSSRNILCPIRSARSYRQSIPHCCQITRRGSSANHEWRPFKPTNMTCCALFYASSASVVALNRDLCSGFCCISPDNVI
jgi:hypothetical protein